MRIVILGTTASSMINFRKELIKKLCIDGHDVFAFAIDYTDESKKNINYGAKPLDL